MTDTEPDKWDIRFLKLARHIAEWSKDPSTKVGAVIVRPNRTVASVGYNGFPRGVEDTEQRLITRELKYQLVMHAEINAILQCPEKPEGYTFYSTMPPCSQCAGYIIQSGVDKVVTIPPAQERWNDSINLAKTMFNEASVEFIMFSSDPTLPNLTSIKI